MLKFVEVSEHNITIINANKLIFKLNFTLPNLV